MSKWTGDWNCRSCHHHNFSWRDACQKCGNLRSSVGDLSDSTGSGSGGSSLGFTVSGHVRLGDWYCSCGGHNFASRSSCHSCGAVKQDSTIGGSDSNDMPGSQGIAYGGGGWKSGDWLCTRSGCNQHNFASRRECYRCKAPKGSGA
ncbi:transcription initiation factor TFIID subunit 15b-like [Musa acuminata AAA Group]|uniref:transcription initiation factor TFIID subunit 15b-like n=1 Tax=Musa acuminata AAA Group TaxID=214697 RepID=UPI0031D968DC